jgi:hypothetical protein
MISYSAPQASIQAKAITAKTPTNALFTKLDFVLNVSSSLQIPSEPAY